MPTSATTAPRRPHSFCRSSSRLPILAIFVAIGFAAAQDVPLRTLLPSTLDTYSRLEPSLAWIHPLNSAGTPTDRCSGFFASRDSILTAYECVAGAARVSVTLSTGKRLVSAAAVLAWDREAD